MAGTAAALVAALAATPPLAAANPTAAAGTGTAPADRPNIVMILADDLDQTTSPYWEAMPKTAGLLRDTGLSFTEAFDPTPICCPARATILTGRYGHNTGVLTNGGDQGGWETFVRNGNEDETFATYLQDAGYHTGLAGKYMNGIENDPTHIPPGWSEWYGGVDNYLYTGYNYDLNENGKITHYGGPENPANYQTDVISAKSTDFIRRASAADEPFFWYAASTAPHLPLPPPPRYASNPFTDDNAPRRPNYQEPDVTDKPTWLQSTAAVRSAEVNAINDRDYRNRMGSLLALDDMVAAIVTELRNTGELANTYLVFTSDNGYNLGAHRLINKMAPYEESLRVPLTIAGPGVPHGVDTHMVTQIDLAPTFLDLAGVDVPAGVDGTSLAPLLRGEAPASWRHDFIGQYAGGGASGQDGIAAEAVSGAADHFVDLPSWSALRTEDYLYVRWYDFEAAPRAHEYELYDLSEDPYQLTNLLATPAGKEQYGPLARQLEARLDQLAACAGASCRA